jgi:hypothetical protein
MNLFLIVTKHFWLLAIFVTFANAFVFHRRSKKHIKKEPELAEGYSKIIRGFVLWGNIPWFVMGVGCTIGGVPSIFHFFRPQDGNPYVQAFLYSVFLVWILGTRWIFLRGGAEMLVKYKGLFGNMSSTVDKLFYNPTSIKLIWLLCFAWLVE